MKKSFLDRAVGNDSARPQYNYIHSNASFDGYRVHVDHSLPDCTCEYCTDRVSQVLNIARRSSNAIFEITTAALVTACKQAIGIGKSPYSARYDHIPPYIPPLRVSVNGSLKYSAISEGNGSVSGEWDNMEFETSRKTNFPVISSYRLHKGGAKFSKCRVTYSHTGKDIEFAVNPKYLLEAIMDMGETVIIKINAYNAPIHITSGQLEAVVMPVNIR